MASTERLPIANRSLKTLKTTATRGVLLDLLTHSSTHSIAKFEEDFFGATLNAQLVAAGSGTAAAASTTGESGSFDLVTGAVDNQTSGFYLAGGNFKGDQDAVVSCRIKLSAITGVNVEFGFCDNIAATVLTTTMLGPFVSPLASPPTLVSTTADAIAFVLDTTSTVSPTTTATWRTAWSRATVAAMANANVTAASIFAATAGVYQRLTIALARQDLATDQMAARFYINGVLVGTVNTAAISNTAPLYPFLLVGSGGGSSRTLTVDHFECYQLRDNTA